MKNKFFLGVVVGAVLMISSASYAYTVKGGDTMSKIAAKSGMTVKQLWALNPFVKNVNMIYVGENINTSSTTASSSVSIKNAPNKPTKPVVKAPPVVVTTPPVTTTVPPVTTPAPTQTTTASGEIKITAYTTSYAWPDNTPPGSDISNPVIHQEAGGTGTFTDPITVAVGHSMATGKDVLDYPAGTKFYLPNLRKYFIAEDTCGDGNSPQNEPCHTDKDNPGYVQLDLWAGGVGQTQAAVLKCEDAVTGLHTVIINPASNYAVNAGAIYTTSCAQQYGETVTTQ